LNPRQAFAERLRFELQQLGLECDASVQDGLSVHFELMVQWGKKVNLTSIFDPVEAARLHGVDALLFDDVLPPAHRIIDAGSGAGFPGVALALRRPDSEVVLLEPLRKRCSFLKVVASRLRLKNIQVVEGRLAALGPEPALARFDAAVSRATWAPFDWVRLGAKLVQPRGHLLVSGGRGAPDSEAVAAVGRDVGFRWLERRRFRLGDADRVLDLLRLTA